MIRVSVKSRTVSCGGRQPLAPPTPHPAHKRLTLPVSTRPVRHSPEPGKCLCPECSLGGPELLTWALSHTPSMGRSRGQRLEDLRPNPKKAALPFTWFFLALLSPMAPFLSSVLWRNFLSSFSTILAWISLLSTLEGARGLLGAHQRPCICIPGQRWVADFSGLGPAQLLLPWSRRGHCSHRSSQ